MRTLAAAPEPEHERDAEPPGGPFTWLVFSVSDNLWRIEISEPVPVLRRDVVYYMPGDEAAAGRVCRRLLGREWRPGEWFAAPAELIVPVSLRAASHFGVRDRRTRRVRSELDHYISGLRQRRYDGPCPACGYDEDEPDAAA